MKVQMITWYELAGGSILHVHRIKIQLMKLAAYLVVSSLSLFFSLAIQARGFIVPSLSELYSENDIVLVAALQSVRPTLERHGNAFVTGSLNCPDPIRKWLCL